MGHDMGISSAAGGAGLLATATVTPAEFWRRIGSPGRAVAVVAHPDDESFGLGAVLGALVDAGTAVELVCFTHGEASTLGADTGLGPRRDAELRAAAAELGSSPSPSSTTPTGTWPRPTPPLCVRSSMRTSSARMSSSCSSRAA